MAVGPQSSVNVSVNFQDSTNSLSREINRGLKGFNVQGMRGLDTAFGNITKNVRTFDTALDRANQRVILFAASASILYGTIRAFGEMAKATVDVEKSMISINSVFRLTNQQLDQFSKGLFNVALSTSQSFDKVAEAAQEFSRQGLSASETIKRTRDAMILTRLAAIDTAEAVTVLTATINGFAKEGLNSTQITNRLATVDAAFAVSTKDLVGALTRVGSAASDAGLSFNELVGLVTTAKQITGREGPVIAQALNTIFTRLNRKDTIDALDGLGVSVRDLGTGALLPTLQILQNFSSSYDQMTGTIRTQAAELVGGVRNLNTLKAVIGDLAKGNSVYSQTQQTLSQTTNQAYLRNEELNTSLDATIQRFGTIGKQFSANLGNVGFAGPLKTFLGGFNNNPITEAFRDATGQAETTGGKVAEGFLKGFGGAVIFGIGPILAKGLFSVVKNTIGNLVADVALAGGLTKESQVQAVIQNQIVALYGQGNAELAKQLALTTSIAERALIIKAALESNVSIGLAAESQLAAEAAAIRGLGYRPLRPKGAAGGYIPGAIGAETAAIGAGVGGAPMGARPVLLPSFNFGGGKSGPLVANSSEFLVPHMAGGSAIYNREMIRKFGLPPGATPVAAGGWVPNAANAYNVPPSYRSIPSDPAYAFGIKPGPYSSYMGPAGSTSASTAGGAMGLQQVLENEAKQKIILEKQKQNAEYEARVLSQRETAAEGEIQAFAAEKTRIQSVAASVAATKSVYPSTYVSSVGRSLPISQSISSPVSLPTVSGDPATEAIRQKIYQQRFGKSSGGNFAGFAQRMLSDPANASLAREIEQEIADATKKDAGPSTDELKAAVRLKQIKENRETRLKEIEVQNERLDKLRKKLYKTQEQAININLEATNQEKATSLENLGLARRQAIRNQANLRVNGGATFEQLTPAERASFVQQAQLKAAKSLGFGNNVVGALRDSTARSQINLQVARDIYAAKNYTPFVTGGMIGPPSPFNTENGTQPGFFSRLGGRLRSPMGQFGAGVGLSFAGGMISEGKGGTREGMVRGAASTGLEMAGMGMQFGGPMGAGIGAVVGGLYGFLSKINKSFGELAGEIDESKKKLSQELEAAVEVFRIQDKIKEALSGGDEKGLAELQRQRTIQLSRLTPQYRQFVSDNLNAPNGMSDLLRMGNTSNGNSSSGFGILSALKYSDTMSGIMGGKRNQRGAASEAFVPALGGLSRDELEKLQILAKENLPEALTQIGKRNGLNKNLDYQELVKTAGSRDLGSASVQDTARYGITSAINKLLSQLANPKEQDAKDKKDAVIRQNLIDLSATLRTQANFISITGAANQQISQTRQQIALANPTLTDVTKLQLTGQLGAQNIAEQANVLTRAKVKSGQADLTTIMSSDRGGVGQASIDKVGTLSNLEQFTAFKDKLLTLEGKKEYQNLGAPNSPFLKKIEDIIRELADVRFATKENTRVNNTSTDALLEQLRFYKTYKGAQEQDMGAFINAKQALGESIIRKDPEEVIAQKRLTTEQLKIQILRRQGSKKQGQSDSEILAGSMAFDVNRQVSANKAYIEGSRPQQMKIGLKADQSAFDRSMAENATALGIAQELGDTDKINALMIEQNRLRQEQSRRLKEINSVQERINVGVYDANSALDTEIEKTDILLAIAKERGDEEDSINQLLNKRRDLGLEEQFRSGNLSESQLRLDRLRNRAAQTQGSIFSTGSQVESDQMAVAKELGLQGNSKQSFTEGFHAKFNGLKKDLKDFAEVGNTVANSLSANLGNAFGDFITGAQKGKEAFRSFILGVLNDSARAFASKAVQGLLGMVFSSLIGGATNTGAVGQGLFLAPGQSASGGYIGLAAGGRVPTMLTGGEYAFGPTAASKLGPSMLTGLNNGTIRKMASGGSLIRGGSGVMDDVPAMLKPGTFIVKKAMTERYGVPFLSALANSDGGANGSITMGMGGETTTMMSTVNPLMRAMGGNITNIFNSTSSSPIKMAGGGTISAPSSYPVMPGGANVMMTSHAPSMTPIRMAGGGMLPSPFQMMTDGGTVTTITTNAAGLGGGNSNTFNIGVTVNDNSSSSSSSQTSAGGMSPLADRKFAESLALRMKQVAVQAIEEQTRMGGMLRRQSLRST